VFARSMLWLFFPSLSFLFFGASMHRNILWRFSFFFFSFFFLLLVLHLAIRKFLRFFLYLVLYLGCTLEFSSRITSPHPTFMPACFTFSPYICFPSLIPSAILLLLHSIYCIWTVGILLRCTRNIE